MRRVVCTLVVAVAAVWFVPTALASVIPSVTLSPSSVTAGSTGNLGVDIKFTDSGTDTPKNLALALPPGLLADPSIDGGACLKSTKLTSACQIGTGTVTASTVVGSTVTPGLAIPVTFDLVAPPASGDIAGVAIVVGDVARLSTGTQLGPTGSVVLDSATGALDIEFTNLPNNLPLGLLGVSLPIQVTEIDSTFDNLHMPTSCPSPPANVVVATVSYQDPAAVPTAQAPLTVTGCSGGGSSGGGSSGGGSGSGTGSGGGSPRTGAKSARPKLSSGSASGLTKGKPTVRFTVGVSRTAAKLLALSIRLPNGLSFNRSRVHGRSVSGLTLNGNGVTAATLKGGALVVALKRPVWSLTVKMGSKLLKESKALKKKANARRHRLSNLKVTVGTEDANGETFGPSMVIRKLHLPKLKPKHHKK